MVFELTQITAPEVVQYFTTLSANKLIMIFARVMSISCYRQRTQHIRYFFKYIYLKMYDVHFNIRIQKYIFVF